MPLELNIFNPGLGAWSNLERVNPADKEEGVSLPGGGGAKNLVVDSINLHRFSKQAGPRVG